EAEQHERIQTMQQRIRSYDVFKWADDFLSTLDEIKQKQQRLEAKFLSRTTREKMISGFKNAAHRILFLDYDGTLAPIAPTPQQAIPDKQLLDILEQLATKKNTHVVIISGRSRSNMEEWFGHMPLNLVAEHGIYIKQAMVANDKQQAAN